MLKKQVRICHYIIKRRREVILLRRFPEPSGAFGPGRTSAARLLNLQVRTNVLDRRWSLAAAMQFHNPILLDARRPYFPPLPPIYPGLKMDLWFSILNRWDLLDDPAILSSPRV
jgi:hypothetical protein